MKIEKICINNIDIAIIQSDELLLYDIDSALDFIASVNYETECRRTDMCSMDGADSYSMCRRAGRHESRCSDDHAARGQTAQRA